MGKALEPKFYVVWQLVKQLVHIMFITNNQASFHFWWKQSLVKYQKLLKYYVEQYFVESLFQEIYDRFVSVVFNISVNDITLTNFIECENLRDCELFQL